VLVTADFYQEMIEIWGYIACIDDNKASAAEPGMQAFLVHSLAGEADAGQGLRIDDEI
jgi:hypothetical protein